jgi:hypothetical protein
MGTIGSKKCIESFANKVLIRKAKGEDESGADDYQGTATRSTHKKVNYLVDSVVGGA